MTGAQLEKQLSTSNSRATLGNDAKEEECNVCVAVHIRPLIEAEAVQGCSEIVDVTPGAPQVSVSGKHQFTYDHVFGGKHGSPPGQLYDRCVRPLVEGLFKGYNATVLAYGQTGSGKTHTMGSAFSPGGPRIGVIPSAMETLFDLIRSDSDKHEYAVTASFVEIYQEEIRDLLADRSALAPAVVVREMPSGGVCLSGATEVPVSGIEDMVACVERGTLCRATSATGMNRRSSRSHAIFTISLEKRRREEGGTGVAEDEGEIDDADYVCAKMHLVDLAGSERAKRTKAEGQRLKEGIHINRGLLALSNVISALCDETRRGGHVPYRDSRLTRLLQDSLGGNARTVMIACVSPADINMDESINTLKYADRARMIRNKPTVNRDPMTAELSSLRQQLARAKAELAAARAALGTGGSRPQTAAVGHDEVWQAAMEELEARAMRAESEVERLKAELRHAVQRMVQSQAHRDQWQRKYEEAAEAARRAGVDLPKEPSDGALPEGHSTQEYLQRIADLESENARLKGEMTVTEAFLSAKRMSVDYAPAQAESLLEEAEDVSGDEMGDALGGDVEGEVEEKEYLMEQRRLGACMEDLSRQLREKEAQMRQMGQVSALKAAYDKKLAELESERSSLEEERGKLQKTLREMKRSGAANAAEKEARHRQRLGELEGRLKSLEREQRKLKVLEKTKAQAEEACTKLEAEIRAMKQQRVQLAKQMEAARKEFQEYRKEKEKEAMQLKREGRKNRLQMERIKALHEKQQQVLKRKTEEAEAARRRLKEITARQAATTRPVSARATEDGPECQPNSMAPLLRDERSRQEWLESELDTMLRWKEIRRVLEGETAQRAALGQTLHQKRQDLQRALRGGNMAEAEALQGEVASMEARMEKHSKEIAELQQELSQARVERGDEKRMAAMDVRRWSGIRNTMEGRTMLRTLFRLAAQERESRAETEESLTEAREQVEMLKIEKVALRRELEDAIRQKAAAEAASFAALQTAKQVVTPQRPSPLPRTGPASQGLPPAAPAMSPVSWRMVGGLTRAAPGGVWQSVALDPRQSVPDEEVGRLVREMRLAEATLGAASDGTGSRTTSGQSGSQASPSTPSLGNPSLQEEGSSMSDASESASDSGDEAWDPSMATPVAETPLQAPRRGRRHAARVRPRATDTPERRDAGAPSGRAGSEESRGTSQGSGASGDSNPGATMVDPEARAAWELPVMDGINRERQLRGQSPVKKLTVRVLRENLTGRIIHGKVWRAGRKDKDRMVADYRLMLGLAEWPTVLPERQAGTSVSLSEGISGRLNRPAGPHVGFVTNLRGNAGGAREQAAAPAQFAWAQAVPASHTVGSTAADGDVEMMDCDGTPPPGGATSPLTPNSDGSSRSIARAQQFLQRAQAARQRADAFMARALSRGSSSPASGGQPSVSGSKWDTASEDVAMGSPVEVGSGQGGRSSASPMRPPLSSLSPNSVRQSGSLSIKGHTIASRGGSFGMPQQTQSGSQGNTLGQSFSFAP